MPERLEAIKQRIDPNNRVLLDSAELLGKAQCSTSELESHLSENYTGLDFSELMSGRVDGSVRAATADGTYHGPV